MDHPMVAQIERTGYPFSDRREEWGIDALGNEVFSGEEILETEDEFFLVQELTEQSKEVIEILGGRYKIAK